MEFRFQQEHGGKTDGGFAGRVGGADGGGFLRVERGEDQDKVDVGSRAQSAFGAAAVEDYGAQVGAEDFEGRLEEVCDGGGYGFGEAGQLRRDRWGHKESMVNQQPRAQRKE